MTSIDDDSRWIDGPLAIDRLTREECGPRLSGLVWRILRGRFQRSKAKAEDVLQEIFPTLDEDDLRPRRSWRGSAPSDA